MPSLQRAAYEFNKAARDLEKASSDLKKRMEAQFNTLAEITKQVKQIHFFVAQKLIPRIRRILNTNWGQSGLKSRSGGLKAAAIDGALIEVTAGGIKITFAGGLSKQIYVQGAAQNFGAVHGGGGIASKTKKKIKGAALKSSKTGAELGAVRVTPAHPFFYLSPEQINDLQQEYVRLWQEELNRRLGAGKTVAKGR